jgi:type I restriction enzyme R subunit
MAFNEDSRVKIPAILHLTRLGYEYLPLKHAAWDPQTNIFTDLFRTSLTRINPDTSPDDIERVRLELLALLDYEDLGKAFHERLLRTDGIRLIDFDNFDNNSFHVVTELPCRHGEDEFRPDITLLLNGMPLFFMEVKKAKETPCSVAL